MPRRKLPDLTPEQVVNAQDALLANADRLLSAALAVLDLDNVGLARSLAILGMEESGKAIAIHERRVAMAFAPEGEPFVTEEFSDLWASHQRKLELVHRFLVAEQYWFGVEPSNPDDNRAYLGAIRSWTKRHDKLKQRGFYVDLDRSGNPLTPDAVADRETMADVIRHVHQIGWQLRLGEHIEASSQAQYAEAVPPATEADMDRWRAILSGMGDEEFVENLLAGLREGKAARPLNNDAYRLKLRPADADPFADLGKPGYEAEARELAWMMEELDVKDAERAAQAEAAEDA
ncbi:AbiV family abortive infection protein [Nocardioides sp. WV_118_6]